MATHNVRYGHSCALCADSLGGYQILDEAGYGLMEALSRKPHEFQIVDTIWGSVRYAITKKTKGIPELVWYFVIEGNGDVEITHVEEFESTEEDQ